VLLNRISMEYDGQQVIPSLTLRVEPHEIFVLLGPSGSGKTTLLKGISGLEALASGELIWGDTKGEVGYVFQEPRLFPHMTVAENLAFGLRVRGCSRAERTGRVRELIGILKLEGLEKRYPHQLSGGQKQRVALGRVLILEPDILLLDEPFSSLDTPLRIELIEWLYQLQRDKKFTILWVTHSLEEALMVADRIGVMIQGELMQFGPPMEVYRHPRSEKVASFFSLPNRFSHGKWIRWFPMLREAEVRGDAGWIPAERMKLKQMQETTLSLEDTEDCIVWWKGQVERVKFQKNGAIAEVRSAGEKWEVFIHAEEDASRLLKRGDEVMLGILRTGIIWYSNEERVVNDA
jgi:ABC-type sugar transport system ATPase subunit